jgi:hypothetical protein
MPYSIELLIQNFLNLFKKKNQPCYRHYFEGADFECLKCGYSSRTLKTVDDETE